MSGAAAEAFPFADLGASAWPSLLRLGPARPRRWRPACRWRPARRCLSGARRPSPLSSVLSVAVRCACPYRLVLLFTGFQNPINPRLTVPSVLRLRDSVTSLCAVLPAQRPCRCFLPISYMKPLCCVVFLFSPNWQALLSSRRLRRRPFLFLGSLFLLFRLISVSAPDSCALAHRSCRSCRSAALENWRTTTGPEIVQSSLLQRFEVIVPPVLALLCCLVFLVHCSTPCFVISSLPFFSRKDCVKVLACLPV
jgi:hypothetical protein